MCYYYNAQSLSLKSLSYPYCSTIDLFVFVFVYLLLCHYYKPFFYTFSTTDLLNILRVVNSAKYLY